MGGADGGEAGRPVATLEVGDAVTCRVDVGSDGRFELRAVPAESYRLTLRGQDFEPVVLPVDVRGEDVYLAIPVGADGRLAECLASRSCARVLTHRTQQERAADPGRQLELVAYRTAAASSGASMMEWAVCLSHPDEDLLTSLRELLPRVHAAGRCNPPPLVYRPPALILSPRFHDGEADRPDARSSSPDSDDPVDVTVGWLRGPEWGGGWRCRFERVSAVWMATSCETAWSA